MPKPKLKYLLVRVPIASHAAADRLCKRAFGVSFYEATSTMIQDARDALRKPRKPKAEKKVYRLLENGEIICAGDEWQVAPSGAWNPCVTTVGRFYSPALLSLTRRLVTKAP